MKKEKNDANFEDLNNVQIEKRRNFRVAHFFSARTPRALVVFWSLLPSLSFAVIERKIVKKKYFPLVEKTEIFFSLFVPLLREFMKN